MPADPLSPLLIYPLVIATAGIAAAVNSMAGGGTFLTFPALTGIARLSEKVANMTSTLGLWPGAGSSIYAAREDFKKIPRKMIVIFGIVSFIGGLAGSLLLIYTSNTTFKLVIPWLLAFATVVFGFSKPISRWAASHGAHAGHTSTRWTVIIALIQFIIAIYGGYFGAGIGVLMLAGLSFAGLESLHLINTLKVCLSAIINCTSATIFICLPIMPFLHDSPDHIVWPLAGGMAGAAVVGGFLGMKFARRLKQDKLRAIILSIGILLTLIYFYKGYFAAGHASLPRRA
jgi:hypothetical protein